MIKEVSNKIIYNDFINKTTLTDDEKEVLDMLIQKYSIVKISQLTCMSERSVSRVIRSIKDKYIDYKKLELAKLNILFNQI